jgi:hypothetical protein
LHDNKEKEKILQFPQLLKKYENKLKEDKLNVR